MVIATGDFNATSTGLDPKSVSIPNHLKQLVASGILDWFCTNRPHLFHLQRIPKVAASDHYTILARLTEISPPNRILSVGSGLGSAELITGETLAVGWQAKTGRRFSLPLPVHKNSRSVSLRLLGTGRTLLSTNFGGTRPNVISNLKIPFITTIKSTTLPKATLKNGGSKSSR